MVIGILVKVAIVVVVLAISVPALKYGSDAARNPGDAIRASLMDALDETLDAVLGEDNPNDPGFFSDPQDPNAETYIYDENLCNPVS